MTAAVRSILVLLVLARAQVLLAAEPASATLANPKARAALPIVTLRGRVICLPEEAHRGHDIDLPSRHEHLWALRATNGLIYTILPGRYAAAIFQDDRVRARELQLRVRIPPQSQAIDVLTVHSVKAGVVQDLYYYCDICAIKSISSEPCACCQGPVELKEEPLGP